MCVHAHGTHMAQRILYWMVKEDLSDKVTSQQSPERSRAPSLVEICRKRILSTYRGPDGSCALHSLGSKGSRAQELGTQCRWIPRGTEATVRHWL